MQTKFGSRKVTLFHVVSLYKIFRDKKLQRKRPKSTFFVSLKLDLQAWPKISSVNQFLKIADRWRVVTSYEPNNMAFSDSDNGSLVDEDFIARVNVLPYQFEPLASARDSSEESTNDEETGYHSV